MYQGSFKDVSRKFKKFQECFKSVSRKFQGYFKKVLREFSVGFKGI